MTIEIDINQGVQLSIRDIMRRSFEGYTLRVDYWAPGNNTAIPTGSLPSGYFSASTFTLTITIPKNFFTTRGRWVLRIVDTETEAPWKDNIIFDVYNPLDN